jgi:pseudouridine-5'-phosphate glycosidase
MNGLIHIRPDVQDALDHRRPVVALESTLFVHGLPRPINLQVAAEIERIVRDEGGIPATIGVVAGRIVVGLSPDQIERLSTAGDVPKVSVRDLPVVVARGSDGATTVASTAVLANRTGIDVFATGGLGGVHRGASESWDESADLVTLSRTPITVVCAGVKSILDVAATLERLESLSVTVVGYRTDRFPGFYLADSGFGVDWTVNSEEEVAAIMAAREALAGESALIVANPVHPDRELDHDLHDRALGEALSAADRNGIRGKAVTPFVLDHFHRATEERSLRVNMDIIYANARLAARIARARAKPPETATGTPLRLVP